MGTLFAWFEVLTVERVLRTKKCAENVWSNEQRMETFSWVHSKSGKETIMCAEVLAV